MHLHLNLYLSLRSSLANKRIVEYGKFIHFGLPEKRRDMKTENDVPELSYIQEKI